MLHWTIVSLSNWVRSFSFLFLRLLISFVKTLNWTNKQVDIEICGTRPPAERAKLTSLNDFKTIKTCLLIYLNTYIIKRGCFFVAHHSQIISLLEIYHWEVNETLIHLNQNSYSDSWILYSHFNMKLACSSRSDIRAREKNSRRKKKQGRPRGESVPPHSFSRSTI